MFRYLPRLGLVASLATIASACTEQSLEVPAPTELRRQAAVSPTPGPRLIITEVHGNPAGSESNGAGEWFEVFNAGDASFPVQSVTISSITGSGGVENVTLNTG